MELAGHRVLVVGGGKSGLAAARFCVARGAVVTLTDKRAQLALPDGVRGELGGHRLESFTGAELIVLSPGVPPSLPELEAARAGAVTITGEVELASRFIEAPVVAVTGTNGKSTVTALAGEIARHTGRPTFVGGNLGTPLIECVGTPAASSEGIVVVELSSFQLETCETLRPRAAALLNVTPDHLDRYPDVEAYGRAKLRIAQRMGDGDILIVNGADRWLVERTRALAERVPTSCYAAEPYRPGLEAYLDGEALVTSLEGGEERYPLAELNLIGRHNAGNALAALSLMRQSGLASYAQVRAALRAFRPLPHRMQLVRERRGVRFYDDSKATNVDSVVAGVDGFPMPFVLIAGGRDKGGSYAPLVEALARSACKTVVLIGEAADQIAAALGERVPHERAGSLQAAVARGAELAGRGEAVVLSPACSSYDMFENYEHRGRVFRQTAEALAE